MLTRIHSSSSFFPPFSTVPIALCFHLHLILISEFNTCNTELQVIFLRLLADCPRHGYQESLTSIFPYFLKLTWTTYTWRKWMHISKMFLSVVCYFQTCCHWWLQLWFLKRRRCMSTSEMFENVAQYFQVECGNNKNWNSHLQGVLRCMI